ncbi:MAG: hypothetical protein NTY01_16095, partial [Verrucomicrobia bacterium]|nr:hypothetical protein [Verrucomicrobiota bacterium]
HDYVSDARQRIEAYRKLAQAAAVEEIGSLRQELRDRFGKLPAAAELLLQLATLKLFAGNVGVTNIETRGDRIMLSRGDDYVQTGGKFPRLSGQTATVKLKDIHRVLAELRKATSQQQAPR